MSALEGIIPDPTLLSSDVAEAAFAKGSAIER